MDKTTRRDASIYRLTHNITNPGVLASFALEDPQFFECIVGDYRDLILAVLEKPQSEQIEQYIFMQGVFKKAIELVQYKLGIITKSPVITKHGL